MRAQCARCASLSHCAVRAVQRCCACCPTVLYVLLYRAVPAVQAKSRALPGISTALSHRLSATVLAAQDPRQPLPGCSALVAAAPASAIEAQARALISGAHRQQQAPTVRWPRGLGLHFRASVLDPFL